MDDAVEAIFHRSGLDAPVQPIDETWLARLLRESYGIDGRLSRLDTEKDNSYRLDEVFRGAGREFLVKVSPPDEPFDVVRCQVDVIRWIEQHDPTIPVQTVVAALDGARCRTIVDDEGAFRGVLRVHDFLPGRLLIEERPSTEQLRRVGAMLGRVDAALQDFSHPGEERVLVWDLARFPSLEPLVELESDPHRRDFAQRVFDGFRERVVPAMPTARTQMLHGDFSPYNVVVDPATEAYVAGVIDFGDAMRAPVIFDPAVLLGNHLQSAPGHPWEPARELLTGYRGTFPLDDDEAGMLIDASLARVALRALVANWRLTRGTERAEYVRAHARHDWARLENAVAYGHDAAHAYLTQGEKER